jgi:hypothetical protein
MAKGPRYHETVEVSLWARCQVTATNSLPSGYSPKCNSSRLHTVIHRSSTIP